MKAILVPVDGMPRSIEVDGLKDLQRAVGGRIEPCSWIFNDQPAVYVNEEGKLGGCTPNRAVYATAEDAGAVTWDGHEIEEGDVLDIIYGDFVCIGFDDETGADRDISDEEAARVETRFGTPWSVESGWAEALCIKARAMAAGL